jgi:hypothetical protein
MAATQAADLRVSYGRGFVTAEQKEQWIKNRKAMERDTGRIL